MNFNNFLVFFYDDCNESIIQIWIITVKLRYAMIQF